MCNLHISLSSVDYLEILYGDAFFFYLPLYLLLILSIHKFKNITIEYSLYNTDIYHNYLLNKIDKLDQQEHQQFFIIINLYYFNEIFFIFYLYQNK